MSNWQRTWRATVENFLREVRGGPEDARRDAMADALGETRDRLREAEAQLDDARERASEEARAEEDCRRRGAMAERIGDADTAAVAAQFATRHAERRGVLARKVIVLEDEVRLLRRDLDEMLAAYDSAEAELEAGEAAPAGGAAGGAADPREDPLRSELDALDEQRRQREADARLEELKRRAREG